MLIKKSDKHELPRPILKIEIGPADWILEGLSLIALLSFFGFVLYQYRLLPDSIPTHFNASGKPDDFDKKETLWVLPGVTLILYAILTFVSRIPEKFNFPVVVTPANARVQYTLSLRLIRYLKLALTLVFFYIGYSIATIAREQERTIGLWFLPAVIGVVILPVIIYIVLARRYR